MCFHQVVRHARGGEAWFLLGDKVVALFIEGLGGIMRLNVTFGSRGQLAARESGREGH